ncbi:MATE family efflux transporter [Cognatiyoonia sp. IB215182]|uniref:MATE family efflux transporter n=1 Tax=Cognatiyoonia sp. IB215182 TaxID=3097353 RepID=UPI002A1843E9|nr:MATE family efflux transporter [Cognatiyoonia sp. IB215182]MDX8350940.1 MATE family efflux transporter [Cognatiyoonia sp. IB215182]
MTSEITNINEPPAGSNLWSEAKALTALGFPIVISLAAATLIGVVDTIMIAPLGTVPLAAASITASVILIFYSALYGFVSIIGVRMAEAQGRGSAEALSDATWTGVIVATVTGMIGAGLMLAAKPALGLIGQPEEVTDVIGGYWTAMSLLLIPYTVFYALKALFDAIGRPWLGVGLAFVAVVVNVPANLVLIYGIGGWPGLGLLGAGVASLLSQTVPLIFAWVIWKRAKSTSKARQPKQRSRIELLVQIKEGSAIAIGYVGEGGAYAVAGLMMGWFGAVALAANQIVASIGGVLYMVPLGISIAVSIRIGQAIGAEERTRLVSIGKAALLVIVTWMTLVMIGIFLGGRGIANLLSDDPDVVMLAASMFLIVAAMQIADGVQGTMLGAARGMMDNRVPVAITLVCYWVIALPLGYVLGFVVDLGPNGVWIGYGSGLAIAAVALTRRYFMMAR